MKEFKKISQNTTLQEQMQSYAKTYDAQDKAREKIIVGARDVLKPAKQSIYLLLKNDKEEAMKLLSEAETKIKTLLELKQTEELTEKETGSLNGAIEEYVEAQSLAFLMEHHKFPLREEIPFPETLPLNLYLQGLGDVSGELVRLAVQYGTAKDLTSVEAIRNLIQELQGYFLLFHFRNGELRRKADALRGNLHKVQQITYDLSVRS